MFTGIDLYNPSTWTGLALSLLAAAITLLVGWVAARIAQHAVRTWLPRAGGGSVTIAPLAGQAVRYGIIIVAIITALGFVGIPSTSVFAVVGAASLALALALQSTLSNVASGIMLAWIRPIAVGDYIKGDGVEGEVIEIGLFGTRLRSTSGLYVFATNNRIWNGPITNHTREPRRRVDVLVTIPDGADIGRARKTLLSAMARDKRVLKDPAPVVFVDSFATSTVTLAMRFWVPTPDYRAAMRDLTESAKLAINKMLAAGVGGTAEVHEEADPHVAQSAKATPSAS
jgi:small conductance mechanosensitive channel